MKYKKDQWVKINASGEIAKVRSVYQDDTCLLEKDGVILENKGNPRSTILDFTESDLSPAPKTWETLEVGDVLVTDNGNETKVLAVVGETFLRNNIHSSNEAAVWYTKAEVRESWTIKGAQDETIQEVTMNEVREKFGKEVKIKKA